MTAVLFDPRTDLLLEAVDSELRILLGLDKQLLSEDTVYNFLLCTFIFVGFTMCTWFVDFELLTEDFDYVILSPYPLV